MRKRALRFVEFVLLGGSMIGLLRSLALFSGTVRQWFDTKLVTLIVGALSAAFLLWWARRVVTNADRRAARVAEETPRRLTDAQRNDLKSRLSGCEPQLVMVAAYRNQDACRFAEDIQDAIRCARTRREPSGRWAAYQVIDDAAVQVEGVRVELAKYATDGEKDVAARLSSWLRESKLSREKLKHMAEHATPTLFTDEEGRPIPLSRPIAIKITVGAK